MLAHGFALFLEVGYDREDARLAQLPPVGQAGGGDVAAAGVVQVDDQAEVIDREAEVVAEVVDLPGQHRERLGGGVLGLDGDQDAGGALGLAVAAVAVVDGGVHAHAQAGRAVNHDEVVLVFHGAERPFKCLFPGPGPAESDVEKECVGAGGQHV